MKDLVHIRGRMLLEQAIAKYDGDLEARTWVAVSGAALLFASGVTLGAIIQVRYSETDHVIFTAAVTMAFALFALAMGVSFFLDSVVARKKRFITTLESYLDAQHDVAKYSNTEAH